MHNLTWLLLATLLPGCPRSAAPEAALDEPALAAPVNGDAPPPAIANPEVTMPSMPRPPASSLPAVGLLPSDADFALNLLGALDEKGNVVIGPSSVSLALGLLGAGAKGDTAAQLRDALGVSPEASWHAGNHERVARWTAADAGYTVKVANRIYAAHDLAIEPLYQDTVTAAYGAGVERVNFGEGAARESINGWVSDQTLAKIPDLIPPGVLDANTRTVLVNAIYLDADWLSAFDPAATLKQPFYKADGSEATVPLMNQLSSDVRVGTVGKSTIAELPYAGDDLKMLVFLPGKADGLPALEDALRKDGIAAWRDTLTDGDTRLYLPRFTSRTQVRMLPTLTKLGLGPALTSGDYSGISAEPLAVGAVIHEAVIEVDEVGTVAAAATAIVMSRSASAPPLPRMFRADRPFVYAVYDTSSDSVLFLGRYVGPEGS